MPSPLAVNDHGIEWREQVLKLCHNWRCQQPEWLQLLDNIGMGRCNAIDVPAAAARLDVASVIAHVWSDAAAAPTANKAVLTLTLEDAATVNQQVINALPEASIISLSVDTFVDCKEPDMYPEDFVRGLHISGVPHGQLELKVGARYIVIRNIDYRNGIVNGAQILCTAVSFRHVTGAEQHCAAQLQSILCLTSLLTQAPCCTESMPAAQ